jgi:uncharacterized membrane protein YccF (DUF307 family)
MKNVNAVLWLIFGGLFIALEYFIASLLLIVIVIGIPFGFKAMRLGFLSLAPFNKSVIESGDPNTILGIFINLLWFFIGGFWIFLTHVACGILLFITILGIPMGQQHFRMARYAFSPFSKDIVNKVH